jgi:hypothetical protein
MMRSQPTVYALPSTLKAPPIESSGTAGFGLFVALISLVNEPKLNGSSATRAFTFAAACISGSEQESDRVPTGVIFVEAGVSLDWAG